MLFKIKLFMSLPKKKFREAVFQLLYSYDITKAITNDAIDFVADQLKITKKATFNAKDYTMKIVENIEQLDNLIQKECLEYRTERISKIELNILRLSAYEMYFDKIPPKVVLAEAIRLSKKFSTPSGANFVNGILNAIYQKINVKD